ncbi:MAG: phosphatase PAP2 family protein [Bacteroidia bacterium]|nr:phosphatase PAP2 family protein [Bacteroidia bacterium]
MTFKNGAFFFPYAFIIIVLAFVQIRMRQIDISIEINSLHNDVLDQVCKYATYLGDGFFSVLGAIIVFRFNPKLAVCLLISYLLSAGIAQALKHTLFSEYMRPIALIGDTQLKRIHLVDGVDINYKNSFPSGHATSAFAFFTVLAMFAKSNLNKIIYLLLGCFTAFTRIYLLQHFLIDVFTGAIIGSLIALLVIHFLITKNGYELLKSKVKK